MTDYIKARLNERDTKVVIGAAIYSIVRAFVPAEYLLALDTVAGLFGIGVAATPLK